MIEVGDYVRVLFLKENKEETFKLVSIEHNFINMGNDHRGDNDLYYIEELKLDDVHFENNEISDESPLGSALINHSAGDVVSYSTPDYETVEVKILSVSKKQEEYEENE